MILSSGEAVITWKVHQLMLYCCCGILAGIVGGLLGLGGGFILGPLFLELGIPPQVHFISFNTFSTECPLIKDKKKYLRLPKTKLIISQRGTHTVSTFINVGIKRYCCFCDDIFLLHVRHTILLARTFSSSIW